MRFLKLKQYSLGAAVVNHLSPKSNGAVRTVEHKKFYQLDNRKFSFGDDQAIVETIQDIPCWGLGDHYPIPDEHNVARHKAYQDALSSNVVFGGRVGAYKYLDIDQTISAAISLWKKQSWN